MKRASRQASSRPLGLSSRPNRVPVQAGKASSKTKSTSSRKPAWDSTIHDLKDLKLSPEERKAKRQHETKYRPAVVKSTQPAPQRKRKPVSKPKAKPTPDQIAQRLAKLERDAKLLQLSEGATEIDHTASIVDLIMKNQAPTVGDRVREEQEEDAATLDDSMYPSENPFFNDSLNLTPGTPGANKQEAGGEQGTDSTTDIGYNDENDGDDDNDSAEDLNDKENGGPAPAAGMRDPLKSLDMSALKGLDIDRFLRYIQHGNSSQVQMQDVEDEDDVHHHDHDHHPHHRQQEAEERDTNQISVSQSVTPEVIYSARTSTHHATPPERAVVSAGTTCDGPSVNRDKSVVGVQEEEGESTHCHHHNHSEHHEHAEHMKDGQLPPAVSAFGGTYPPTKPKKPMQQPPNYIHEAFADVHDKPKKSSKAPRPVMKQAQQLSRQAAPVRTTGVASKATSGRADLPPPESTRRNSHNDGGSSTSTAAVPVGAKKRAALTGKPFMIEMDKIMQAASVLDDQVAAFEEETGRNVDAHGNPIESGKRSLQRRQGLGVLSEGLISTMARLVGYLTQVERQSKIRDVEHNATRDDLHAVTETTRSLEQRVSLLETENRSLRDELRSVQTNCDQKLAEMQAAVTRLQRSSDAAHFQRMVSSLQFGGQANVPASSVGLAAQIDAAEQADAIASKMTEQPLMSMYSALPTTITTTAQQQLQKAEVRVEATAPSATLDLEDVQVDTGATEQVVMTAAGQARIISPPQQQQQQQQQQQRQQRQVNYTHPDDDQARARSMFGDNALATGLTGSTYTARNLQTGTAPEVVSSLAHTNFMEEPLRRTIDARGRHVVRRTFPARSRDEQAATVPVASSSGPDAVVGTEAKVELGKGRVSKPVVVTRHQVEAEVHIPLHSSHYHDDNDDDSAGSVQQLGQYGGSSYDNSSDDEAIPNERSRTEIPRPTLLSQGTDHIALALANGYSNQALTPSRAIQWSQLGRQEMYDDDVIEE